MNVNTKKSLPIEEKIKHDYKIISQLEKSNDLLQNATSSDEDVEAKMKERLIQHQKDILTQALANWEDGPIYYGLLISPSPFKQSPA